MKNNKVIKIGGKEYTFEVNRNTIIKGEEVFGVSLSKMEDQLISQSLKIWVTGLELHHSELKVDERMDLYEQYNEEVGKSGEVVSFIMEKISNFFSPTHTTKKNK